MGLIRKLLRTARQNSLSAFNIRDLKVENRHRTIPAIEALARGVFIGNETVLCRVLGKYKIYADTEDLSISPHLIMNGLWELWVAEFIVEHIKPGMVAVDIGANLGYFTLLFADLVGRHGSVHAFEPNPRMIDRLRRSVVANGFDHLVRIHQTALGRQDGSLQLVVPTGHPGGGFVAAIDEATDRASMVDVRRLDSDPELLGADFIKIDAEAAEEDIWHGMAGLLARRKALTVLLEFVACRYADPGGFLDAIIDEDLSLAYLDHQNGLRETTKAEILALPSTTELMIVARRG